MPNEPDDRTLALRTPLVNGPTLVIEGTPSGSLDEFTSQTLTFTVLVSDPRTLPANMKLTATIPGMTPSDGFVSVGQLMPVSPNAFTSTATVTFSVNAIAYAVGDIPITLTATDIFGLTATAVYDLNIVPEDPAPYIQPLRPITFNEGNPLGTDGHGTEMFFVQSTTSLGADNTGALTFAVSSSNTALISSADVSITPEGSPGNELLSVNSESGQSGTATLTLTATNGTTSTQSDVVVTVAPQDVFPTVSAASTLAYTETSAAQTLSVGFTVAGAGGLPSVALADPGAPAGWQTPTLTLGPDGHDTATLVLGPDTYGNGVLDILATSQGIYGQSITTTQSIAVTGAHVNLDFGVPATQSFTIAENDGNAVLTGFGSVPITNPNGDTFTYSIVGGNPSVSATDPTPLFFVSNTGRFYVNGPTPYVPGTPNKHVLAVRVSNGAHTHTDQVMVHIADNSPPVLTLTETPAHRASAHAAITPGSIAIAATDPHGLAIQFAITGQTDASGARPYFIAGQSSKAGHASGLIFVHPNAPISSAADTLTITATDTQGLQTVQDIVFNPDQIVIGGMPETAWQPVGHDWFVFHH